MSDDVNQAVCWGLLRQAEDEAALLRTELAEARALLTDAARTLDDEGLPLADTIQAWLAGQT